MISYNVAKQVVEELCRWFSIPDEFLETMGFEGAVVLALELYGRSKSAAAFRNRAMRVVKMAAVIYYDLDNKLLGRTGK